MKVFLILFINIIAIFVYFIWLKIYRRKETKRIYNILLQDYLGKTFEMLLQIIKKTTFERIFRNGIKEDKGYKYIYTYSPNLKTIKIYQFQDNLCIDFYIQSYEERYSLPYWNYYNEFVHLNKIGFFLTKNDKLRLAAYTIYKFLEPYFETEKLFEVKDDFYFRSYLKVNKDRFLSVNAESPTFGRSSFPLYSFLCSNNPIEMKKFRDYLYENSDFLMTYIIDQKKFNRKLDELNH